MDYFISREKWLIKKDKSVIGKEVIRDNKGRFIKVKRIDKPDFKPFKKKLPDADIVKISLTNKYIIFESNTILPYRGQVLAQWLFKKTSHKTSQIGTSYLSNNVRKDIEKLIDQSRINAYAKSDIIGSPDHETVLSITYKYIVRKSTFLENEK